MLTSIGIFLRKLRIDHRELLKDMADKLHVSVSFLSGVENGKKRMPAAWNTRICELYALNTAQRAEFTAAIAQCENSIELSFDGIAHENRKLAIAFARKFASLDEAELDEISKLIDRGSKGNTAQMRSCSGE